jgi:predicted DNA-binding transcriptional regulator AlpA
MADYLTAKQAAEAAGVKVSTWDAYVSRRYAPVPDKRERGRRYWLDATITEWLGSRPGQGARNDL